jgi:protein tyrosine/serine phosphatase
MPRKAVEKTQMIKRPRHGRRLFHVEWLPRARQMFARAGSYLDMLFVDHGIFRLVYLNRHRLGDNAWRSAQPAPHQIGAMARRGIRTIVNLRGERRCGSYRLERAACERHGIALVNFHMRARRAPTRDELKATIELFERIEYPILIHCKSGADRTGLMSTLYSFLREGVPLAEAKRQLSPRYGYFRHTNSGILGLFIEHYLEDNRRRPVAFIDWIDKVYDPEKLKRTFDSKGWTTRLADQVLKRKLA